MKTESLKTKVLKLVFVILAASYGMLMMNVLSAQTGTFNKEKMKPLTDWAGVWEGEGWNMDESRQRTEFTVTETIQLKLDGSAILAEGLGKNKTSGKVGFQSLGVFYYNNEKQTYEVKSWLANGNMALSKAEMNDKGQMIWGFEVPGGQVRYTITFTNDTWNEKGEFVMAGGQAFPIMEMNLKKVK